MGPKHTRSDILSGALAVTFEHGLSQLSYGRVAKSLGINDRTVVYYFASKDELISEVLLAMGVDLQTTLAEVLGTKVDDYLELTIASWPLLATDEVDPTFALFFEANGLAAAGREPYVTLVPELVEAWIVAASNAIDGSASYRRAEAEAAVALLDGLLLMRQLVGPDAADRAAVRLGVTSAMKSR